MNAPIKIITTVAMQAVFEKLAPAFKDATGRDVVMTYGPPSAAAEMVRNNEEADIVVSTPDAIATLARDGLTGQGSVLCRMQMGLAVGMNEPKPSIATPHEFKAALLRAKSIIHADPKTGSPSAAHFLKVVEQLGIADEVAAKTTRRAGVVAHAVASGECAMAVQQLAELMLVPGVHVLGPFPAELQNYLPLAAAVHAKAQASDAAQKLIDLIAAPSAKSIIEQAGLLSP
ncbi:MAG TPA: substrate-binding domain-containing protein [Pseudolabrys sp.]